jgi:hypothetical protein
MHKVWLHRLAIVGLGALGVPAAPAAAAQPPEAGLRETGLPIVQPEATEAPLTADLAQAKAQDYARRAEDYVRWFGAAAYRGPFLRLAQENSAHYTALAHQLRGDLPPLSPEARHYLQRAEEYRRLGGAAYRLGLVQRAEAQASLYLPHAAPVAGDSALAQHLRWTKPIERFLAGSR